jgi:hypothetical protein
MPSSPLLVYVAPPVSPFDVPELPVPVCDRLSVSMVPDLPVPACAPRSLAPPDFVPPPVLEQVCQHQALRVPVCFPPPMPSAVPRVPRRLPRTRRTQAERYARRKEACEAARASPRGRSPQPAARNEDAASRRRSAAPRTRWGGRAFMEIFAGRGNLERALVARGIQTLSIEAHLGRSFNLLIGSDFAAIKKLIKRRKLRWIHFAPPCGTFSAARKQDKWAKARILRTRDEPLGVGPASARPQFVADADLSLSRIRSPASCGPRLP